MGNTNSSTVPEVRPIPGFPGYYAHSDGMILSAWSVRGPKTAISFKRLRVMRAREHNSMVRVGLSRKGKTVNRSVGAWVLLAFRGEAAPGTECSHLNGDMHDSRLSNLTWETHAENVARRKYEDIPRGSSHGLAKLSEPIVMLSRMLHRRGASSRHLAEMFGVSHSAMKNAISGRTWAHV